MGMIDWSKPRMDPRLSDEEWEARACKAFGHSYCPECEEKETPTAWVCQYCAYRTTERPEFGHSWELGVEF